MRGRMIASLILNLITVVLVILGVAFMLTGYHFMQESLVLTAMGGSAFKYFTVDSNVLMGLIALLFAVLSGLWLDGKIRRIPTWAYVLYLVGAVGVVLTFLTTAGFLAPFLVDDYFSLFTNSNLFFHFVVPMLAFVNFVFLMSTPAVRWRHSFWGMIPMVIYTVFYSVTALSHMVDGKVDFAYDWYGFAQGGPAGIAVVMPVMIGGTYLICYLLWLGNHALGKRYYPVEGPQIASDLDG